MKKMMYLSIVLMTMWYGANLNAQGDFSNNHNGFVEAIPPFYHAQEKKKKADSPQPHVGCGVRKSIIPSAQEIAEIESYHKQKRRKVPTNPIAYTQSIHNAIAKWEQGTVYRFDYGTTPGDDNIYRGHLLRQDERHTGGHSMKELQRFATAQGTNFNEGDDFYLNLYDGPGSQARSFKLKFVWEDLGNATNTVNVRVETNYGAGGAGAYAQWQADDMMEFYSRVVPIIDEIYGPASRSHDISVVNDAFAVGVNIYYNGPNQVSSSWDVNGNNELDQPRLMIHELLHGWRDNVGITSNDEWHYVPELNGFEEGFAEGAALVIMDEFIGRYPNFFQLTDDFKIHWNSSRGMPFEWDYDFQNHKQITNADYFSTDIATGSHWIRYGIGATAMRKMYIEDNDFFKKFNAEYYNRLNADHDLIPSRDLMISILETVKPIVERTPVKKWANDQRILDCRTELGKKVFMLTFTNLSWAAFTQDNRMFFLETHQNGKEWTWASSDQAGASEVPAFDQAAQYSWTHQLNNIDGKFKMINDWDGQLYQSKDIKNDGHWINEAPNGFANRIGIPLIGPYQGANPYNLNGTFTRDHEQDDCNVVPGCGKRAWAIGSQGLYTSTQDIQNFWPRVVSQGGNLLDRRTLPDLNQSGLYRWEIEWLDPQGSPVKETYHRLQGDDFIDIEGVFGGIHNDANENIDGRMYIEHADHGAEVQVDIKNNSFKSTRDWASVPSVPERQGGRSDRHYTDPGKVHSIYINDACDKKKIDFRTIGYGDGLDGVQMFLFNVDDFEDIEFEVTNSGPVCEGEDVILSVTNNFPDIFFDEDRIKYTWKDQNGLVVSSPDDTLATISGITAVQAGEYTLEIEFFGCPKDVYTTEVVVNNGVKLSLQLETVIEECEGENITLSVNDITGATYLWTGPNNFTSSNREADLGALDVSKSGTYQLSVSAPACGGGPNVTADTTVDVNILPSTPIDVDITAPVTEICEGENLDLIATDIVGVTYTWTGPDNLTAQGNVLSLTNLQIAGTGEYKIVAESAGCGSSVVKDSATFDLVVNANPIVTAVVPATIEVCEGQDLALTVDEVTGATYSWIGPDNFTSIEREPVVAGITSVGAGDYIVTVSIAGCDGNPIEETATITVQITTDITVEAIVPKTIETCDGQEVNLSVDEVIGATYSWTGPDNFNSILREAVIASASVTNSGFYVVEVSVTGCSGQAITAKDSIELTVKTDLQLDLLVTSPIDLCAGEDLSLSVNQYNGASYSWIGPNNFTSDLPDITISAVTPMEGGQYEVTVEITACDGSTLSEKEVIDVRVADVITPIVSITGSTEFCEGETLTLEASPVAGGTFTWAKPDGTIVNGQNMDIASIQVADGGWYKVGVAIPGCQIGDIVTVIDSVEVRITEQSTIDLQLPFSTIPACDGDQVTLSTNNPVNVSYTWTGPSNFSSTNAEVIISSLTSTEIGSYQVVVSSLDATDCRIDTTATIEVQYSNNQSLTVTATSPINRCEGDSIKLSVNPILNATYSWIGPNNFSSTEQNPFIENSVAIHAGTYQVEASVASCTGVPITASADVIVSINTIPTITLPLLDSIKLCEGEDAVITLPVLPKTTFNWTGPNNFIETSNEVNLTAVENTDKGYYVIEISTGALCTITLKDSVYLNVIPSSSIDVNFEPLIESCIGIETTLEIDPIQNSNYNWIFNSDTLSQTNQLVFPITEAKDSGVYNVAISVPGCTIGTTIDTLVQIKLSVISIDTVTLEVINNGPMCEGFELVLSASPDLALPIYEWRDPAGVLIHPPSASINLGIYDPTMLGEYIVNVDLGCGIILTDTTIVEEQLPEICDPEEHIYLPNAFSPNGDGENDILQLYGAGITNMYLVVYDRWGQQVFVAVEQTDTWDGSYKGKELDAGVFGYHLKVELESGAVIEQQGNITLVK